MRFEVAGIRIKISFLFCFLLCCILLFDNKTMRISFASVCAHESAHLLAMLVCGQQIAAASFEPFGIIIVRQEVQERFGQKLLILLSGCACNLLLCCAFFGLFQCFKKSDFLLVAFINFLLCVLNALPVKGLDGGAVFGLIAARLFGDKKGATIGKIVSVFTDFLFIIFSVIISFKIRFNPSIFCLSFYLLVYTFLHE